MSDASVRPARPDDAEAVAGVQLRAWRTGYADVLPGPLLSDDVAPELTARWADATTTPPSTRHHVLVAVEDGSVVGFAALAPTEDEDRDRDTHAELLDLLVDPAHTRRGHGSRLLTASADTLRGDGFTHVLAWLLAVDDARRALLTSAGWAADGATRDLQAGTDGHLVHQVRLHTDLRTT